MPCQFGVASGYPSPKAPNLTHQSEGDDPFTRLSNDIIMSLILPRLPLEDAVRTSALCHRWKKLWIESIGPSLIFPYSSDRFYNPDYILQQDVQRFTPLLAHGITHILETYLHPKLEELTICFDFDSSSSQIIDSWIEYALKKGVTQLTLDFSRWRAYFSKANYSFPGVDKFLAWYNLGGGMSNLREICLKSINVSVEIIECLLSNCSLERLGVWKSELLQELRVFKQGTKLKSLEFVDCSYSKIIISSPYLVSLKYSGLRNGLQLLHVPLLSQLSIGSGFCSAFLRNSLITTIGYISQIKRLALDIDHTFIINSVWCPPLLSEFSKLEELEVRLQASCESCLLWPINLVKAAPLLCRFSVKLNTVISERKLKGPRWVDRERNLRTATKQVRHQRLKSIEMYSFSGRANEVELGEHLLGISESLEQFVVKPMLPGNREKPHPDDDKSSSVKTHRELAQQFKTWLPPTAKLVVL